MLSFGLTIPFFTYGLAEADAIQAEHDGFDSVWITDHMINPMKIGGQDAWDQIEAWTAMSAIAARTERVRLGFMMLNPAFRNAALLAKMAATLDQVSRGRLLFSLGAGYLEEEYRQYDLPFDPDPADRLERVREVATLCRELWTRPRERVSFDGRFVSARECYLGVDVVQSPHPPIWFGGDSLSSRRLMDDIAGDGAAGGWYMHPQVLPENLEWFSSTSRHRDQDDFTLATYQICQIADTDDEAAAAARAWVPVHFRYERDFDDTLAYQSIGSAATVIDKLTSMARHGINHIIFVVPDPESRERLLDHVLPAVRRASEAWSS